MSYFTLHSTFFMPANIPDDFDRFFVNGIPINRTDDPRFQGTPQEWEVTSVYTALKVLEFNGIDYLNLRKQIVEAIIVRLNHCNGFWIHDQFTKDNNESHMRYTSAILRLLVEASHDGIMEDKNTIIKLLFKHLSFSDKLAGEAIWFLHDSNELNKDEGGFYKKSIGRGFCGASENNQFVLNTHLDTLVTLAYFKFYFKGLDNHEIQKIDYYFKAGIESLKQVLSYRRFQWIRLIFQYIDKLARYFHFRAYNAYNFRFRHRRKQDKKNRLYKYYHIMNPVHMYFSYFRTPLRAITRSLIHFDGFTERDLFIKGRPGYYHLSNIWDFAKLINMMKLITWEDQIIDKILAMIENGINYAIRTKYYDFIKDSYKHYGMAVMLGETFLILFQQDKKYINAYFDDYLKIRKAIPPSPAMRGYDPVIYNANNDLKYLNSLKAIFMTASCDIILLSANNYLIINSEDTCNEYKISGLSFSKVLDINGQPIKVINNILTIYPNSGILIHK